MRIVPPPKIVPPPFMLNELAINAVPNTLPVGKSRFSQRSATRSSEALQTRLAAVSNSANPNCHKLIWLIAWLNPLRPPPPHSRCSDQIANTSTASHANGAITEISRFVFSMMIGRSITQCVFPLRTGCGKILQHTDSACRTPSDADRGLFREEGDGASVFRGFGVSGRNEV